MPIGLAVAGANVHDQRLVEATLDSIPIPRPRPTRRSKQHLCGDKGYDAAAVRRSARRRRYTPHIRSRGEEQTQRRRGHRARRWVVERIHSWLNRYRRILVRWEKKAVNYVGLLHLVFAHVLWRNCLLWDRLLGRRSEILEGLYDPQQFGRRSHEQGSIRVDPGEPSVSLNVMAI